MRANVPECLFRGGWEADATTLAETACDAFDLFDGDEIPEELFEWSHDVCEDYERAMKE